MFSRVYFTSALRHICLLLTLQSTKMVALVIVAMCLDYCNSLLYGVSSDNLRTCRWHRMHWPEFCVKLREHALPQNRTVHCTGYQWNNASTTHSQFWLTRRCRVEVLRIWHLSLVTMRHLVHRDRRTNSCLAVLSRLSSWLTKHFLSVLQRSGMTCLFTAVPQLEWIVLNVTLSATTNTWNSFSAHISGWPALAGGNYWPWRLQSGMFRVKMPFLTPSQTVSRHWRQLIDWVVVLRPTQHEIGHFRDVLPSQYLGLVLKNRNKHHKSQHASVTKYTKPPKKLKPRLFASYDGDGDGLFCFRHFINLSLTYLLRHLLTNLLRAPGPTNVLTLLMAVNEFVWSWPPLPLSRLPMWLSGEITLSPCAVESDALSGLDSNLSPGASANQWTGR